jgi:transposase
LRRRRDGGAERNALGRSRGGFSTKINARTTAEGLPIGIVITPGQAHDITAVTALMHDIDCDPEQMLGDKGYDSEAIRQDIAERGGQAVIPSIASRKIQHTIDKALYALRNRIERFFNRETHVGSPRDTTSSSKASPPSYCLPLSVSGLNLSTQPSQQPNAHGVAPGYQAIAVVFDLVNPVQARRGLVGG